MRNIIAIAVLVFSIASCSGPENKKPASKQNLQDSISVFEKALFNPEVKKINKNKVLKIINFYTEYAQRYPDDSLSPVYLFKASDVSMNLYRPAETIKILDTILIKYPDYEKTPTALFLKAFIYEDQVKNYDRARKYYQMFIDKYPDNEFADDAQMSLDNLGKSPEELIKSFEKGQK